MNVVESKITENHTCCQICKLFVNTNESKVLCLPLIAVYGEEKKILLPHLLSSASQLKLQNFCGQHRHMSLNLLQYSQHTWVPNRRGDRITRGLKNVIASTHVIVHAQWHLLGCNANVSSWFVVDIEQVRK